MFGLPQSRRKGPGGSGGDRALHPVCRWHLLPTSEATQWGYQSRGAAWGVLRRRAKAWMLPLVPCGFFPAPRPLFVTFSVLEMFGVEEGLMPLHLSGAVRSHLQKPVWRAALEICADWSRGCAYSSPGCARSSPATIITAQAFFSASWDWPDSLLVTSSLPTRCKCFCVPCCCYCFHCDLYHGSWISQCEE